MLNLAQVFGDLKLCEPDGIILPFPEVTSKVGLLILAHDEKDVEREAALREEIEDLTGGRLGPKPTFIFRRCADMEYYDLFDRHERLEGLIEAASDGNLRKTPGKVVAAASVRAAMVYQVTDFTDQVNHGYTKGPPE